MNRRTALKAMIALAWAPRILAGEPPPRLKLYLDGGNDTYIHESDPDQIEARIHWKEI